MEIDFEVAAIGRQRRAFDVDPSVFRPEIARARTFGFVSDVKKLWQAGFALGSSLENSVALDGDRILNPEGLRYADEFVRHKALDAIGDLALAGAPIIGVLSRLSSRPCAQRRVLAALFADRKALRDRRGRAAPGLFALGAGRPAGSPPPTPPTRTERLSPAVAERRPCERSQALSPCARQIDRGAASSHSALSRHNPRSNARSRERAGPGGARTRTEVKSPT